VIKTAVAHQIRPIKLTKQWYMTMYVYTAWTRPAQPVAREQHVARDTYVACGDMWNKTTYFNPFPGQDETKRRRNSENLRAVYLH
jgi:hypothetical protein